MLHYLIQTQGKYRLMEKDPSVQTLFFQSSFKTEKKKKKTVPCLFLCPSLLSLSFSSCIQPTHIPPSPKYIFRYQGLWEWKKNIESNFSHTFQLRYFFQKSLLQALNSLKKRKEKKILVRNSLQRYTKLQFEREKKST